MRLRTALVCFKSASLFQSLPILRVVEPYFERFIWMNPSSENA